MSSKIHRFKFNKLVRDKIPSIIRESSIKVFERALEKDEYTKALKDKLLEETQEVMNAIENKELVEELADVLEVVMAIARSIGKDIEDVQMIADQKRLEKGGFEAGTYIDFIEIGTTHPRFEYYRSHPDKYPEIK